MIMAFLMEILFAAIVIYGISALAALCIPLMACVLAVRLAVYAACIICFAWLVWLLL